MRHVNNRQAKALLQGADFFAHAAPEPGIQIGQWFIKQQHGGFQHQRTRHRDTLLLPARDFGRQPRTKAAQADRCQRCLGAFGGFLFADTGGDQAIGDIFPHAHMRKQRVALKHHGHIAFAGGKQRHIAPANADAPRAWLFQPRNHPQQGSLAAA